MCLPVHVKKQIYYSYIHTHLSYLNTVWGNTTQKELKSIQILQNRAIKHVYNFNFLKPTTEVYSESKILNFVNLKKCNLAKFMYKITNNLIKTEITPKLNQEIHNYSTRFAANYHIDHIRTNFGKYAVLREAIYIFNSLSTELKAVPHYDSFKLRVKKYFIDLQSI